MMLFLWAGRGVEVGGRAGGGVVEKTMGREEAQTIAREEEMKRRKEEKKTRRQEEGKKRRRAETHTIPRRGRG